MGETCPCCGQKLDIQAEIRLESQCEVQRCMSQARYQGWWRVVDPLGFETGLIQRRNVCEKHVPLLIGGQK